jgi:hypothetical protein
VDELGCICGHEKKKIERKQESALLALIGQAASRFVIGKLASNSNGSARVGGVLQQPSAICQPPTGDAHALPSHPATLSCSEIPGRCGTVMHLQGGLVTREDSLLADGGAVSLAPVPG